MNVLLFIEERLWYHYCNLSAKMDRANPWIEGYMNKVR